jgi:hypothetical protein
MAALGLLACGPAWTQAHKEPPIPLGSTIGDFQTACYAAESRFSQQVACIKGLMSSSTDPDNSQSNPDAQLYLLTADKLVDDVQHKRMTAPAARVELQRTYLDIRQRTEAQRAAVQREEAAAARAAAEAQQRAREAEAQAQLERAQLQARAQAAVQYCVEQVRARRQAQYSHTGANGQIQQGINGAFGDPVERNCATNPNAYQAIPPPPVQTNCRGDGYLSPGSNSVDVDLNCTTR